MIKNPEIKILDLNFQNCRNAIASYLVPHQGGIVLIESGPGSTQKKLKENLNQLGYRLSEITHVLLTHIHLDHAGAAGWLAGYGAHIYVHQRGAPHMLNPEKLLASASRIYKDQMDQLWGEFLPVPEDQLTSLSDRDEISVNSLTFQAIDTPGHANHHLVYLLDEICFCGDVGGVRINILGPRHLRVPMPPPEFHPTKWRESIALLKKEKISKIIPTHFGIFDDVEWHLDEVLRELDAAEDWMNQTMPQGHDITELRMLYAKWARNKSVALGVTQTTLDAFEKANPSGMSADGIKRYWEKYVIANIK